mmetsp:Transcript_37140/g.110902  ORF Transcript_37140/g.110902 Transcript_37140/m.110902 type:complete len:214 (+) Transcript_37140:270-911(+)
MSAMTFTSASFLASGMPTTAKVLKSAIFSRRSFAAKASPSNFRRISPRGRTASLLSYSYFTMMLSASMTSTTSAAKKEFPNLASTAWPTSSAPPSSGSSALGMTVLAEKLMTPSSSSSWFIVARPLPSATEIVFWGSRTIADAAARTSGRSTPKLLAVCTNSMIGRPSERSCPVPPTMAICVVFLSPTISILAPVAFSIFSLTAPLKPITLPG